MEYYAVKKNEVCRGFGVTWGKMLIIKVRGKADYTCSHNHGGKRNHVLENPSLSLPLSHIHAFSHPKCTLTNTRAHPIRSTVVFRVIIIIFLFFSAVFKNFYNLKN